MTTDRPVKLSEAQRKRWHIHATGGLFDIDFYTDSLSESITPCFLKRFPEVTIVGNPLPERNDIIIAHRGLGLARLARATGITKQRVNQILLWAGYAGPHMTRRTDRYEFVVAIRKFVRRAYDEARNCGDSRLAGRLARALGSQGFSEQIINDAEALLGEEAPLRRTALNRGKPNAD